MATKETYYFELISDGAEIAISHRILMKEDHERRPGMEAVEVFSSGAELIRALASYRRAVSYFEHPEFRQNKLAAELGVTPGAISRMEREASGKPAREPSMPKLKAYAEQLGFDVLLVCVPRSNKGG